MILNAQDDDDAHIIELLNQGSDNRPPAPSKTVPAHLKADFLSTPPPPPLKVAVDSISSASSSSSCDSDSESDSNTNNDDAKRVHAQLTKKQSQCSHLPRWRIRQPSLATQVAVTAAVFSVWLPTAASFYPPVGSLALDEIEPHLRSEAEARARRAGRVVSPSVEYERGV